jgi:C4-dicarboxylate transporter DctM subunit
MMALGLIALVFVLLWLRQYLVIVLAAAAIYLYLTVGGGQLSNVILDGWDELQKDVLIAIPLYMLAGQLMAEGTMARRLVRIMRALTAPVPAGLAVATCLSCGVFAAIVGSSSVTLLAVGTIMYPALLAGGYSKSFSLGLLCAGATLGIIIPPSIPLILYGVMTGTSIADLFLAGVGPGLLLLGLLTAYSLATQWHLRGKRWEGAEIRVALREGIWALLMPVIILGGIYSGKFTATESAAVASVYALFVELVVYRHLNWRGLKSVVLDTSRLMGGLFPVLMMALSINKLLVYQQVPQMLVGQLETFISSPVGFVLVSNALLLVVGCLMDIGSAILLLAPILQPVAESQGLHPVHFGIMMTVNLEIGYLTPPMGLNLIVAMTAFRESFGFICRAVLPFILLMMVGLIVVAFWPGLSLVMIG